MTHSSWYEKFAVGAVAGCLATVPMRVVMYALQRRLPWWQRYELPPQQIVGDLADAVGIDRRLDHATKNAATGVAHFIYGACMGIPYAAAEENLPGKAVGKGISYGLAVWFVNYLVGLPLANLSAAATREPLRRSAMMIAAHIVWGATLCVIYDARVHTERALIRPTPRRPLAASANGRWSLP